MEDVNNGFENYFSHLKKITFLGRIYKKFYSSPILFLLARRFGPRMIEVGSGTGNGILGTFPKSVHGLDVNPFAVKYCESLGLSVGLINSEGLFPVPDEKFDVCVLDNVLEHIVDPQLTLDECYRITNKEGGLVVAVPGLRGFHSDSDHKKFYEVSDLEMLDSRWQLTNLISTPFFFKNKKLSSSIKQYCLIAVYKKKA